MRVSSGDEGVSAHYLIPIFEFGALLVSDGVGGGVGNDHQLFAMATIIELLSRHESYTRTVATLRTLVDMSSVFWREHLFDL